MMLKFMTPRIAVISALALASAMGAYLLWPKHQTQTELLKDIPFEASLMIHGEKIKSYRSPASLIPGAKKAKFKKAHLNTKTGPAPSASTSVRPDRGLERTKKPAVSVNAAGAKGAAAKAAGAPTGFTNSSMRTGTGAAGATTGTTTSGTSSSDDGPPGSASPATPRIRGVIKPLTGFIALSSPVPFISSAYANTCTDARIMIMDLTNMSVLMDNPLVDEELDADTAFDFSPRELGLDLNTPARYMLQTSGCTVNYRRIISSFFDAQDLDQTTTLVSATINTRIASTLSTLSSDSLKRLYHSVQDTQLPTDTFTDVFNKMDSSPILTQNFQDTFNGGSLNELKDAAPDITAVTVHRTLNEKTAYTYTVNPVHWDSTYDIGIEWQVDAVVKSNTASWTYTPTANTPAIIEISLVVGAKNGGDDNVDRTKPYHVVEFTIAVNNTYPAVSPGFTIASSSTNPTGTRNINLAVLTGTLTDGIYSACENFTDFAVVEDSAAPAPGDFVYSCTTGPNQDIPYTVLKPGDGDVVLKIIARDIDGLLTAFPSTYTLNVDTEGPEIAFTGIQPSYRANTSPTFTWTLTESTVLASENFEVQFYDGSSWTAWPDVALTNGPHNATTFSITHLLPNIIASGAKIQVSYTNSLGQTSVEESSLFNIVKPNLGSTPTTLAFGNVANKVDSGVLSISFTNGGTSATNTCSAITVGGAQASEFTIVSDACAGQVIAGSASCAVTVKVHPDNKGLRSGTLNLDCSGDTYSTTVTANSLNTVPTVANQTVSTPEETALIISFGPSTDVDLDTLTYAVSTAPTHGTLTSCGVTSGQYRCTYTPAANYFGADSFVHHSNDGTVDSNSATVTINVTNLNDAPVLTATQSITTNEDTALNFTLNTATDVDGDTLTYIIVTNPGQGTVSCTGTSCTYTPPADFEGTTTFTYKANDGTVDSNVATVTVNVTNVNDAPVIGANQAISTNEDTAHAFTLNAATDIDVPAQTLSYKLISAPTKGVLSGCIDTGSYQTSRNCTYTPNLDQIGTDTFTYRAYDSITDSVSVATVTITITPMNDPPVLAATQAVTTAEDTPLTFNLNAGTDVDGDTLTYIRVTNTASGSVTCTGGTSRSCTYTPAADFNGTTTFTYKANDGGSDSNIATVTITITPVNDPPVVAANTSFNVDDNVATAITLPAATDIDGGALSYKLVTGPSHGTLTNCITTGSYVNDLTCTYTGNTNYNGTDTFTYLAYDTFTDSVSVTTITINVSDKTPSAAPTIILASNQYTNSTATTFTATSCTDTPFIFFNEGSAPASGAGGWQACTTTAAALTYTMGSSYGAHTVKAWSKDAYGNVSTASTDFTLYYDNVLPTLALTTPPAQRGGATYNFAWTATEDYTTTSLNFTVEFFNGSSWSTVGTTASTAGPLSTTAFTRSWTVSTLNITNAAFRVSFTDRAGNTRTTTSANFTIDSLAPSLAISSPANNTYHGSSTTISGTCETGVNVNFSGDLQSSFSIACAGGVYSQLINFSNGDGNKAINVNQTDAVGNSTTVTRNLIRDEVAPIMTRTTGVSPDFTQNDTPNTWGGTCEGNYTITVSGSQNTTFNCVSGSWSWTPAPKYTDGTFTYNLIQTDAAGNTSSPPLELSWKRDATPPTFTINSPFIAATGSTTSITNNLNSITFTGNCEEIRPITVTGATSQSFSCSNGSWTWTTPTVSTDASRTYILSHTDSAGNAAILTINWTRDTTGPALTIGQNLRKTNTATVTFNGACTDGLNVDISGAETSATSCSGGAWSWTTASAGVDATRDYTFVQTNTVSPFNSTTVTAKWIRETDRPTVSTFTTTAPNPSRSSYIPVSMQATSQNSQVYLSHICFKTNDSTQPSAGDACFVAVNSPSFGLPLSQTVSLTNYSYLLGWTPQDYDLYVWVKDEAANVSQLGPSQGTDYIDTGYLPGIPPTIWDVMAANINNAPLPPTRGQSEVPAGTDVFIRWKATDNAALPNNSISIFYTVDEITFNTVVSGIDISDHGCGITLAANEGCYRWVGGSPLNSAYKIRVRVTDTTDISVQSISNPLNTGRIRILAGNTEAGLNGSAQTAMFFTQRQGDQPDVNTLVVSQQGNFYFADYKRGILTIDQADGKQKVFIPATGASTGDGGAAVNATLNYAFMIILDHQNRMLIKDGDRIRRVDLRQTTPTIETIIGGGGQGTDTVANPRDLYMYPFGARDWWGSNRTFFATPNGDIYFDTESHYYKHESVNTGLRMRVYRASTGQINSFYLDGTGDTWVPTQDLRKCRLVHPGFQYDTATSNLTGITAMAWHNPGFAGCNDQDNIVRAKFDPSTFQAVPAPAGFDVARWWHMPNHIGLDGKMYINEARNNIVRFNFDGTFNRIIGNGLPGETADDLPAADNYADVANFFVTATGKKYYTDRGAIRTIQPDGTIKTLFGQKATYGNGINALNARLANVYRAFLLNNGKIVLNDFVGAYIKEFSVEGNINVIAGNGLMETPNIGLPATATSNAQSEFMVVNRATGEVYNIYDRDGRNSIVRLNRGTGYWEHVIGDRSNNGLAYYQAPDGTTGMGLRSGGGDYWSGRSFIIGFENNKLIMNHMRNYADTNGVNQWQDAMLKMYDSTDSFKISHLAGKTGIEYGSGRRICDAHLGPVATTSCGMPHWDSIRQIQWDAIGNRWIFWLNWADGSMWENRVFSMQQGGTVQQIAVLPRNIAESGLFRREGSDEMFYYCDWISPTSAQIRKYNITTATDLGLLPWSMTTMSCKGVSLDYNAANNSIIFPFEQNGLNGVAEYFLP